MRLAILCFASLLFLNANAQRPDPDAIPTDKGMLTIQPIIHATLVMTWNGKTIYVDPSAPAKAFDGLAAPDLILITDIHGDHMNKETLAALPTDHTIFVVPQAVADQLPDTYKSREVVIANGGSTMQLGIPIRAIPMYNLPEAPDAFHTKGRGNGYILTLGGKQIYLSGDTADIPEMRALKDIDVAFVCMNLPYTMDINHAASAVLAFKPKIVYPYHYRGKDGLSDVAGFKKLVNDGDSSIDVRLRNWYPTY